MLWLPIWLVTLAAQSSVFLSIVRLDCASALTETLHDELMSVEKSGLVVLPAMLTDIVPSPRLPGVTFAFQVDLSQAVLPNEAVSDRDDLGIHAADLDQSCEIVGITRHDAVRVVGKQRDMTVNHVVSSGDRK